MGASSAQAVTFTKNETIAIADLSTASPYPSTITVTGQNQITDLNVILINYSHTFPNDVSAVVRSPSGQSFLLMRGTGDHTPMTMGEQITFDDEAASQIPNEGALTTGSYKPGAHQELASISFPAPGPLSNYLNPGPIGGGSATLGVFDSLASYNPNGVWKLFVQDTGTGDIGQIQNGWAIDITTGAVQQLEPPSLPSVSPPSGSNQNTVTISGSVDPESNIVSLFRSPDCTKGVVNEADPLPSGAFQFQGETVPDNSTTAYSVSSDKPGSISTCSDPVTYTEVTPPPEPPVQDPPAQTPTKKKCKKGAKLKKGKCVKKKRKK